MGLSPVLNLDRYYGLVFYQAKKVYYKLLAAGAEDTKIEDLKQEGFVGLLEARKSYDPKKGAAFSTHATRRIDGAIKDYLRKIDPLTQTKRKKAKNLETARENFIKSLGREPSTAELAQALDISEENVREIEASRVIFLYLDSTEETATHVFWKLPSPWSNPEEELIFVEQSEKVADDVNYCLKSALTDQEERVLIYRTRDELTFEEVGELEGFSKDTAKRREMKARSKMRQCLNSKGWQVTDILQLLP